MFVPRWGTNSHHQPLNCTWECGTAATCHPDARAWPVKVGPPVTLVVRRFARALDREITGSRQRRAALHIFDHMHSNSALVMVGLGIEHEAQALIERDVRGHQLVRVEAQAL